MLRHGAGLPANKFRSEEYLLECQKRTERAAYLHRNAGLIRIHVPSMYTAWDGQLHRRGEGPAGTPRSLCTHGAWISYLNNIQHREDMKAKSGGRSDPVWPLLWRAYHIAPATYPRPASNSISEPFGGLGSNIQAQGQGRITGQRGQSKERKAKRVRIVEPNSTGLSRSKRQKPAFSASASATNPAATLFNTFPDSNTDLMDFNFDIRRIDPSLGADDSHKSYDLEMLEGGTLPQTDQEWDIFFGSTKQKGESVNMVAETKLSRSSSIKARTASSFGKLVFARKRL